MARYHLISVLASAFFVAAGCGGSNSKSSDSDGQALTVSDHEGSSVASQNAAIGVRVRSLADVSDKVNDPPVKEGAAVLVCPKSPAADSGIESGDILVAIDDLAVRNSRDFDSAMLRQRPGKSLTAELWRESKTGNHRWEKVTASITPVSVERMAILWLGRISIDDFGSTVHFHRTLPRDVTGLTPEILRARSGESGLNFHANFWGSSWLSLKYVEFESDGHKLPLRLTPSFYRQDEEHGKRHEWGAITPSPDDIQQIESMIAQSKVVVQFVGENKTIDTEWAGDDLLAVRDVFAAYQASKRDPDLFLRTFERSGDP